MKFQSVQKTKQNEKIEIIFVNEKILEKYSVKIDKIGRYFYEHYKEKIPVDKSGCQYLLFRIDVYFTESLLAVEFDEKGHTNRDLFLSKKGKKYQKKLGCKFIRINTSKKAMMQTLKLVEYKHLSVNLKAGK